MRTKCRWLLHAACVDAGNRDRKANAAGLVAIGKIKRFHQPHMLDMRIAQNLGKIIDWRSRHVTAIHFFKPVGSAAAFENRCQNINANGLIFRAVGLCQKPCITCQIIHANGGANLMP